METRSGTGSPDIVILGAVVEDDAQGSFQVFQKESSHRENINLAEENSLRLVVNGRTYGRLMNSPGFEDELVIGFLFSEGLITDIKDIVDLELEGDWSYTDASGRAAMVRLNERNYPGELSGLGPILTTSGARVGMISEVAPAPEAVITDCETLSPSILRQCFQNLVKHQPVYRLTGGCHGAAVFRRDGSFVCCREDVGRHNALDKVIGLSLVEGWSFEDKIVVLSGRASLEMVHKAARCGAAVVICPSSPTEPAVRAAERLNMTLIKHRKDGALIVFSQAWRVAGR